MDALLPGDVMRRAAKRDTTEDDIVAALKRAGCRVLRLNQAGVADLLVKAPDGQMSLLECKSPGGLLTSTQRAWFAAWGDIRIVHTAAEALDAVGANRLWTICSRETDASRS